MTDQILIMGKLRKWFWYYGVLPLVVAYVICLNFAAEFVNIVVIFTVVLEGVNGNLHLGF